MLLRQLLTLTSLLLLTINLAPALLRAADWPQFRGLGGSGVSADTKPLPLEWSESKNLQWKLDLPGPGHSCPIVVGDRVFVTCWSGYGMSRDELGDQANLKRHLICVDSKAGTVMWDNPVPAAIPGQ